MSRCTPARNRCWGTLGAALLCLSVVGAAAAEEPGDAAAIFQKRILPIFQSPNPSSCTECHLAAVDLKQYILPTQEETFAALLKLEMIDPDAPEKSRILKFIQRKPEENRLIPDNVRRAEFEAFRNWIVAAAKDPALRKVSKDVKAGPTVPDEVIRHARVDRVLQSFIDNVWSEAGRCAACHSPDRNQEQVKKHGEQVSWIKLNDPQGTLNHMLESGIIDVDAPEDSYLLLKPTNQVEHGGGIKLQVGDRTYRQFLKFVTDYAATVQGEYKTAAELPRQDAEVFQVSDIWFKLEGVPEKYDQKLLRVDLYRQSDDGGEAWSAERWATADRGVFGKGQLWQNHLSLSAPRGSKRAGAIRSQPQLPPGTYLARIYVDTTDRLAKDGQAELSDRDLVGEVRVESRWPAGYGKMTIVKFPQRD